MKEVKVGFVDIYHGKSFTLGNNRAPAFEGTVKLSDGKRLRFKAWHEPNNSYTKGERFSGAIFDLVEDE
jgi:hypothetical protein